MRWTALAVLMVVWSVPAVHAANARSDQRLSDQSADSDSVDENVQDDAAGEQENSTSEPGLNASSHDRHSTPKLDAQGGEEDMKYDTVVDDGDVEVDESSDNPDGSSAQSVKKP